MRLAVYGAVLVIALGGVLLGLDWLSAPMSPMVNTEAGLRAVAPPPPPAIAGSGCGSSGNCTARRPLARRLFHPTWCRRDQVHRFRPGPRRGRHRPNRSLRRSLRCAVMSARARPPIVRSAHPTARICRPPASANFARNKRRPVPWICLRLMAEPPWQAGRFVLNGGTSRNRRATMQFLVYLTVLMVSVSTVLLEVHWLTSPPPQPKAAVQAASAAPPAPKAEGPNPTLSPVYPTKADASPTQGDGTQQAQTPAGNAPRVIPGATVQPVPAQQPVASATPPSQATATAASATGGCHAAGSKSRRSKRQALRRARRNQKPAASRLDPPSRQRHQTIAVMSRLAQVHTNLSGLPIVRINLSRVRDGYARSHRRDAAQRAKSATNRSSHASSIVRNPRI